MWDLESGHLTFGSSSSSVFGEASLSPSIKWKCLLVSSTSWGYWEQNTNEQMSRFLASYNLLYKAGYTSIPTPSGELSPERPTVSELPSLSSFAYFICLTLVDRIININVQPSWIMHLKQENFLLPLLSHTSSYKPSELQPVTKMPQKMKT